MKDIQKRIETILETTEKNTLGFLLSLNDDRYGPNIDKNDLPFDNEKVNQWIIRNWDEEVVKSIESEQYLDPNRYDQEDGGIVGYDVDGVEETESILLLGVQISGPDDHQILIVGWFDDGMHRESIGALYPTTFGLDGAVKRFIKTI